MIYLFLSFFTRKTNLCTLKCTSDGQCSNGEKCIKGECTSGCSNDDHCKRGENCYQGKCEASCKNGISGCPKGRYCHIDFNVCLLPCQSDKNCGIDYKCSKRGHCQKPCRNDKECSNNDQYCNK